MTIQIWRLLVAPPANFSSKNGGDEWKRWKVWVGRLLLRRVCVASRKQEHIQKKTDVSFLKKLLVSRNELRELENIDARNLDVLLAIFLLQVQKKDRRSRRTIRAHIPEVFCFKLVSAFSVQHFISMKTQDVLRDLPLLLNLHLVQIFVICSFHFSENSLYTCNKQLTS